MGRHQKSQQLFDDLGILRGIGSHCRQLVKVIHFFKQRLLRTGILFLDKMAQLGQHEKAEEAVAFFGIPGCSLKLQHQLLQFIRLGLGNFLGQIELERIRRGNFAVLDVVLVADDPFGPQHPIGLEHILRVAVGLRNFAEPFDDRADRNDQVLRLFVLQFVDERLSQLVTLFQQPVRIAVHQQKFDEAGRDAGENDALIRSEKKMQIIAETKIIVEILVVMIGGQHDAGLFPDNRALQGGGFLQHFRNRQIPAEDAVQEMIFLQLEDEIICMRIPFHDGFFLFVQYRDDSLERLDQLGIFDRLQKIGVRLHLDGGARIFEIIEAADEDDADPREDFPDFLCQTQAVHEGHPDIGQQDIRLDIHDRGQCHFPVGGFP